MDKKLHPPIQNIMKPAKYPKTELKQLPNNRKCTIDDIADFVVDYVQKSAGEIVNDTFGEHYKSPRALGKLYRKINYVPADASSYVGTATNVEHDVDAAIRHFVPTNINDPRLLQDEISGKIMRKLSRLIPLDFNTNDEELVEMEILNQYRTFAIQLQYISANCALYPRRPLSEEECWAGTITARSSMPRARQDRQGRLRQQCNELVSAVRAALAAAEHEDLEDWLHRTWLAWVVSRALGQTFGAQSYGYIALGSMFEALKELEEREEMISRK